MSLIQKFVFVCAAALLQTVTLTGSASASSYGLPGPSANPAAWGSHYPITTPQAGGAQILGAPLPTDQYWPACYFDRVNPNQSCYAHCADTRYNNWHNLLPYNTVLQPPYQVYETTTCCPNGFHYATYVNQVFVYSCVKN
jgi:hypothetical protein